MTYEIAISIQLEFTHKVRVKVEYNRDIQQVNSVKLQGGTEIKELLELSEIEEIAIGCEKAYLEQEQEMFWGGIS